MTGGVTLGSSFMIQESLAGAEVFMLGYSLLRGLQGSSRIG
jgi:hypothetical protein